MRVVITENQLKTPAYDMKFIIALFQDLVSYYQVERLGIISKVREIDMCNGEHTIL